MASLLIELALTRLFSVLLFYHFAFMAISLSLLGLGAGGLLSYWIAGDRPLEKLWTRLTWLAAAYAVMTVGVLLVVVRILTWTDSLNAALTVLYFVSTIPFVFAGVILSLLLSRTSEFAGSVYFADLAGAGCGCLLLIPLLNWLGGPNALLCAAVAAAISAVIWSALGGGDWRRWILLPVLLVVIIAANKQVPFLDVVRAKGQDFSKENFSKWNSFSRVGLTDIYIRIDADATTRVADIPLTNGEFWRDAAQRYGPGLVYWIHPGASALIIGPGGGFDVGRALAMGSKDVTGVEINPIIINDIMLGVARKSSHEIYLRPEVNIVVEDGRSFVRRSPRRYGVIQATLVDTWASISAGAFTLTENNLYTVEAFQEYLRHLEPDGILSITRWEFKQPREALRLLSLGVEALRSEGVTDPAKHFVVIIDGQLSEMGTSATMLMKRSPWTAEELAAVRSGGTTPICMPDQRFDNAFDQLLHAADRDAFYRAYPYDVTPVYDNRPFFFFNVRTSGLLDMWTGGETMDRKVNTGLLMLLAVLAASTLGVILFLLVPARLSARLPREPGVSRWLLYFCAIGLAFILVEVAFIQKFVLFLGHPTYALTVAVFWLLAASAIGSYWTRSFSEETVRARLPRLLLGAAAIVALLSAGVTPLLTALVSWPLSARIAVAAVLLAPAGFLMGTAFPCALRLCGRSFPGALQWAWTMNAATSVLGSALAVFLSIHMGIWQTMICGGACYVVAAVLARTDQPQITQISQI